MDGGENWGTLYLCSRRSYIMDKQEELERKIHKGTSWRTNSTGTGCEKNLSKEPETLNSPCSRKIGFLRSIVVSWEYT